MTAVIALEHTRMWPGEVAAALVAWQEAALVGTFDRRFGRCECEECGGDAPRRRLQQALIALPAWAGPHLYALVLPIDRYYLRRTSPAPPASPDSDWAWWQRRRPRPGHGPPVGAPFRPDGSYSVAMDVEFSSEMWFWRGPAPWHFVTVPDEECRDLETTAAAVSYGWGMIPVTARIRETQWKTSLFPKDGRYIVPVKAGVRKAEGLDVGDVVTVRLTVEL